MQFLSLQVQGVSGAKTTLRQFKELLSECSFPCQNILQSGLALLRHSDMRKVLETLDIPVSVILGTKDALVPVAVGQYLCDNYLKIQLNSIEGAGHALFLSHTPQVLAVISQFMDEQ
jgi:pimeloyl-[acyl-carrier protein] methyl ester esterase